MAFRYHASTRHGNHFLTNDYVVENGQTVSYGDIVQLANGVIRRMASNSTTVLGIVQTFDDSTGNAAGTVTVKVCVDPGAIFETDQLGGLGAAALQPGDAVDINATADGITTDANHDFRVWHHDTARALVYVQVTPNRRLFI